MLAVKWKIVWLLAGLLAVSGIREEVFSGNGTAIVAEEAETEETEAPEEILTVSYEQLLEKEAELKEQLKEKEAALEAGQATQTEVMDLQEAVREVRLQQLACCAGEKEAREGTDEKSFDK